MSNPPLHLIQTELSAVQKGDWFLPMTVKEVNQHSLIDQALAKGASGFTYEEGFMNLIPSSAFTQNYSSVPQLRDYLFSLAVEKRAEQKTEIAVIAGSAGKTSVKELVGAILKTWLGHGSFLSPANLNTKIALATQILRLPETCSHAVFEMGARRTGDFQVPLSYLQPSVVALLNIGTAHVGEFGSLENLHKEKLSCLNASTAKTVVVPGDDEMIFNHAQKTQKKVLSFGFKKHNDVFIKNEDGEFITLAIHGEAVRFHCPFTASAKALNVAAAITVSMALQVPMNVIAAGLSSFKGVPRRFQSFRWNDVAAIDDAFNSSPESLFEGLQELRKISDGKKVLLVLGSMLELGDTAESKHREAAHQVQSLFANQSFAVTTVGSEAGFIADELKSLGVQNVSQYSDSDAASEIRSLKHNYDLIYFKGSKSIQLHKIFGDL